MVSRLYMFFFMLILLCLPLSGLTATNKVALVIGNSHYVHADDLPNPVRDAKAMAEALRGLGFKVHEHLDMKRREMRKVLRQFKRDLAPGTISVVYYAGHGIQVGQENYLLPVDTDISEEYEVPDEGLSQSSILRALRAADTGLGIVMMDACRNNPFERSIRGMSRAAGKGLGLAPVDAIRGTVISYATQPGNIAVDGAGEHSPYTEALLEYMVQPGLNVQDMFNRVGLRVLEKTAYKQEPWLSVSPIPDFCFAGCELPNWLTAHDGVEAQRQIMHFRHLFESRNLDGIESIAALSRKQRKQLRHIFDRYSDLVVEIRNLEVKEKKGLVTAVVSIVEARDKSGNRVLPAASWGNIPIELKKQSKGWNKISWN